MQQDGVSIPQKPKRSIARDKEITTIEKVVISFLLIGLILIVNYIGKSIYLRLASPTHNSIIVGGQRRGFTLIPFIGFTPTRYAFSIEKLNKISFPLP